MYGITGGRGYGEKCCKSKTLFFCSRKLIDNRKREENDMSA